MALKRPAKGAPMPPNVSHGPPALRSASSWVASSAVGDSGLLPPSMYTSPDRPRAPGLPLKSQVAYAVVIVPPSEWPPTTTLPPRCFASLTTRCRSSISVRMPHSCA